MKRSAAPSVALEHSIKSTKIGKFATPFKDATITATGSCRAGDKENVQIGDSVKLFYDSKSQGILIVNGRFATLKDLEGKDIGRTSGLKSSELESLCEGSALSIGGKDVEILNELSEDSYKSGRCFSQTIEETNLPAGKTMLTYNAPFSLPHPALPRSSCLSKLAKPKTIRPRHNPEADGAVVLPRPNSNLQWKQNKQGCPIVDVVVDPVISSHLRPHQKDGVIFLYKCIMGMGEFNGNGAILADEMGLGKTLQCISLIWTLLKQGPYSSKPVIKRALVVTPGSLVKNWYTEFKKWLGSERVRVLAVSSAKHIEEFGKSLIHPVMVVSYEMLLRYISKVKCFGFDLLVCDEAHRLKNFSIKTSAAITSLCIERIILLTGTPIQNDLKEFFTLAQLCNPGIFGTSSSFRQVFENPINKSQQPNCSVDDDELGKQRAAEDGDPSILVLHIYCYNSNSWFFSGMGH
eukprot:gene15360-6592_t